MEPRRLGRVDAGVVKIAESALWWSWPGGFFDHPDPAG
jgi:hypothetical protein